MSVCVTLGGSLNGHYTEGQLNDNKFVCVEIKIYKLSFSVKRCCLPVSKQTHHLVKPTYHNGLRE